MTKGKKHFILIYRIDAFSILMNVFTINVVYLLLVCILKVHPLYYWNSWYVNKMNEWKNVCVCVGSIIIIRKKTSYNFFCVYLIYYVSVRSIALPVFSRHMCGNYFYLYFTHTQALGIKYIVFVIKNILCFQGLSYTQLFEIDRVRKFCHVCDNKKKVVQLRLHKEEQFSVWMIWWAGICQGHS